MLEIGLASVDLARAAIEQVEWADARGFTGQELQYSSAASKDELRRSSNYLILTPEEGPAYCRQQRYLGHYVAVNPLISGIDPAPSWRGLELIAERIIPGLEKDEAARAKEQSE